MKNFISHAGAMLQHGPETNNPKGENPDEPVYWQYQDKNGEMINTNKCGQAHSVVNWKRRICMLFEDGPAPCQQALLRI